MSKIKDMIKLMDKQQGCSISAYLNVTFMKRLKFIELDIPVFNFRSSKAYEEFLVDVDGEITCHRFVHRSYYAKLEWLPLDKNFIPILFSHCVRSEMDKKEVEQPVLIIRVPPVIDDEGIFMTRFTLIERSLLPYSISPFDIDAIIDLHP